MSIDAEHYIQTNQERQAALQQEYDPLRGIGSPIPRRPVRLSEELGLVYVPADMAEHAAVHQILDAGSVHAWAKEKGVDPSLAVDNFHRLRWTFDFEFWCATRVRIKNKQGEEVPLVQWRPQRLLTERLEAQRRAGEPVRQITLKHRQWGSTTLSYTYIAWHMIELYKGRDAWIVGLDQDNARDVISRFDRIREAYGYDFEPYAGMQNTRIIPERESTISAGTVQRPNAPSGRTPQYVQLTEVGKWPSNATVSAERVVQNVQSMLVDEPGTVSIIESTAQGETGTYYKELCDMARAGKIEADFLFVGAYMDPQYQLEPKVGRPLESYKPRDIERFVASWDEDKREYWALGATLEHLNWYAVEERKPGYATKPWLIKEEYPETAKEAFQTGQKRVIPARYVEPQKAVCKNPERTGRLTADGRTGPDALSGIEFEADARGELQVWREPGDLYGVFPQAEYRHRYVAATDVGPGQSKDASYSVTCVLDRLPTLFGAPAEIAAQWRGHLDPDLYAWEAARLAKWYDTAYWIIEVNSYESDKSMDERDPQYGLTVLNEIKNIYPDNALYHREQYDKNLGEMVNKLGWWTSRGSKEMMISALQKHLRGYKDYQEGEDVEHAYIERDVGATQEMDAYIQEGKKMKPAAGKHDDRLDTRALACFGNQDMPPVRKVEERETERRTASGPAVI